MHHFTGTCQCWPTSKNSLQLYADTGCSLEDRPGAMDDRDGGIEWDREIHSCQCWPTSKNSLQLYADTGCSLEDRPGAMDDRDGWGERERERGGRERERERERVRIICAGSVTWWWRSIPCYLPVLGTEPLLSDDFTQMHFSTKRPSPPCHVSCWKDNCSNILSDKNY